MYAWKPKELSEENITTPATSDNSFASNLLIHHSKIALNFEENCLKQDTVTFNHRNVVNLFFVYKLDIWLSDLCTDFTLKGCLFGAVKLTKKADPDKYFYSGYVIRIDSLSHFLISNLDFGNYF